jgi:hypothetical protein
MAWKGIVQAPKAHPAGRIMLAGGFGSILYLAQKYTVPHGAMSEFRDFIVDEFFHALEDSTRYNVRRYLLIMTQIMAYELMSGVCLFVCLFFVCFCLL